MTLVSTSLAAEIKAPEINYASLSPMLILFGAACLGVLVEAVYSQERSAFVRRGVQVILTLGAIVASFVSVILIHSRNSVTAAGAVATDSAGLFLQGSILALGAVGVLLIAEHALTPGGEFAHNAALSTDENASSASPRAERIGRTEVFPLALFALAGMLLFVSANDLILMFVALEVLSLPLYLLCGLAARRRLLSQEASLKYFLLGAFSSAFFLYGVALLYGYAGTVSLGGIHDAVVASSGSDTLLLMGVAMLAVGLLFKAGLVPFHSWTPDVYVGAPTPITGFMAACTKVAAFGALLRVVYVSFGALEWDVRPVLVIVAILTMLVGSVMAVTQTDLKRLLAYSSIANAGFILTGVLALSERGVSSTLFYLVAYGFTTLGAFAIVMLVRNTDGEATHLRNWAGLSRRSPLVAGVMTFFMLAFAGIPLTSGFTSKFAVFAAALDADQTAVVIVGVIASMVLAFPYLRLVVMMYLTPASDTQAVQGGGADVQIPSAYTTAAVALGAVATLVLGVAPEPLLTLAADAAHFVR